MMIAKQIWAVAAMAALTTGCGNSGANLVPVSGTVTLNGKPFEGASVKFLPDASNQDGLPGEDVTGPTGNYKVRTLGRAGLVAGKSRVVVNKEWLDIEISKVPDEFKGDPMMIRMALGPPPSARKASGRSNNSPSPTKIQGEFTEEVPEGGKVLDFDVKSKLQDRPLSIEG